MNICEAGHDKHETRVVTINPYNSMYDIEVYEAEKYRDTRGYCTGDDVLSRSILETGMWEKWDTNLMLSNHVFKGNTVIDIGAHVGWYSLLAASLGCIVESYEGDPENARLLEGSAERNGWSDLITVHPEWVGEGWTFDVDVNGKIDLIKVDIEGLEVYAIDGLWGFIQSDKVEHLFLEISPVFNDTYVGLVSRLLDAGYSAMVSGYESFPLPSLEWIVDCHQVDILFSKMR